MLPIVLVSLKSLAYRALVNGGGPAGRNCDGASDRPGRHVRELRYGAGRERGWRGAPLAQGRSSQEGRRRRREAIGASPREDRVGDRLAPRKPARDRGTVFLRAEDCQGDGEPGVERAFLGRVQLHERGIRRLNSRRISRSSGRSGRCDVDGRVAARDAVHGIEDRGLHDGRDAGGHRRRRPSDQRRAEHRLVPVGDLVSPGGSSNQGHDDECEQTSVSAFHHVSPFASATNSVALKPTKPLCHGSCVAVPGFNDWLRRTSRKVRRRPWFG